MKIGLAAPFGNSPRRDIAFFRDFAATTESLGFVSLWLPEHVVFFPTDVYESKYPYTKDGTPPWQKAEDTVGVYDPLLLAAVGASVTKNLRFATSVLILPQRPALLTAKEVLTLDHITDGRFDFGVGGGWSSEEYEALGISFAKRGKRFDEYIEAIRVAWTQDRASYHGEFVSFDDVVLLPKPITPGGPPFLIGGDSPAAMRRAARLGDGWYGWWANYELEPHLDKLRAALQEQGRSPEDDNFQLKLGLPYTGTPDELGRKLAEAERLGVEELVVSVGVRSKSFEADLRLWADAIGLAA